MSCIFTTKTYGAYKFQHPHIFYTRAHVTRQPAFTATRSRFAKLTALRLLINGDSYQSFAHQLRLSGFGVLKDLGLRFLIAGFFDSAGLGIGS